MGQLAEALKEAIELLDKESGIVPVLQKEDYWSKSIKFIEEIVERGEVLSVIHNSYWYSHVLWGLDKKRVKELNYYKAGGYAFMLQSDLRSLLLEKREKMRMDVEVQTLRDSIPGIPKAKELMIICLERL